MSKRQSGFTIVELLIVIVIIAILAAITIVAYNGIQERALNSDRDARITSIQKALEMYYIDNGEYPTSVSCGSTAINVSWCTTADASWDTFASRLNGGSRGVILDSVPEDPISVPDLSPYIAAGGSNFAYFSYSGERCGSAGGQYYLLMYRRDGGISAQLDRKADCSSGTGMSNYSYVSEILVTK